MGFPQPECIYQCPCEEGAGEGGGGNWRQQSLLSDPSNNRHLLPGIKASVALKNSLLGIKNRAVLHPIDRPEPLLRTVRVTKFMDK